MRQWAAGSDWAATGSFVRLFANSKGKDLVALQAPDGKESTIGTRFMSADDKVYLKSIQAETKS